MPARGGGDEYLSIRVVRSHKQMWRPRYHKGHAHQFYWLDFVVLVHFGKGY